LPFGSHIQACRVLARDAIPAINPEIQSGNKTWQEALLE